MAQKLIKVAREFNVGLHTIVETLHHKGFPNVEQKPTAEISDEMLAVLQKEFQKDLAIKQEADKLARPTLKKEAGAAPGASPAAPAPAPPAGGRPSLLPPREDGNRSSALPPRPETPASPKREEAEPVQRERAGGLRIVGKIDLDGSKPATQPEPTPQTSEVSKTSEVSPQASEGSQTSEVLKTSEVSPQTSEVSRTSEASSPAETPAPPAPPKEKETARPDVLGRRNRPEDGRPERNDRNDRNNRNDRSGRPERSDRPMPPRDNRPAPTPAPAPPPEPAPSATPAGEEGVERTPDSEFYRAEAPQLRGLKILGRVNLDAPKPEGGNNNNRGGRGNDNRGGRGGDNRGARGGDNRGGQQGQRPGAPGQGQGQGQGQPGQPQRAPGTGDPNDPRRKRKRKTVQQPITAESLQASMSGNQGDRRGPGPGTRGPGAGPGAGNRGPGLGRPDQPKEVSQKEIEDKIRQTMARMGAGASRKGQKRRRDKRDLMRERAEMAELAQNEGGKKLQVTEFISVSDLASLMNVRPADVIKACMTLGIFVSINQRLDAELIEVVASEFGFEIQFISAEEQVEVEEEEIDDPADLVWRQPIVTVMGHVDHGKTSLLDFIRSANVAGGEAGGITQHIGAYEVVVNDDPTKKITFLDTPGHEAFTAMRARGAKVTDIAIIVVAADDSIMPQTREAISHAQAAGVPIVFAINKIDKPGADPERIKNELAQMNFLVEEWGGKYQSQDISAKQGTNIDKLLEKVLLEAELLDLKANPKRRAVGTVLEASLDKGRGYVTKVLIQNGTLDDGDPIIAGEFAGKVKAMFNERGKKIKHAGPATPVLVLGLAGAPQAGEILKEPATEAEAKEIAAKRSQIIREQANRASKRISLEEIGRRLALGNFKELKLIVKGDVDGSVEALSDSLIKLSMEKIQVSVIHKAVGGIVDSDVMLASASDAIIIGFQVRPSLTARKLAEKEGVEIKLYSIIYEAIEEIKAAMEGMLEPTKEEEIMGQVEIREVYKISKVGTVAGSYVQEGKISRNHHIRLIRDGIVVYPVNPGQHAELASLKRFKEDIKEVRAGLECGLTIKNFNDMKVGDIVESYTINEVKATLK